MGNVPSEEHDTPKLPTIDSAWTHLGVFTRHSLEYMVEHGEWEVCTHTPAQIVLLSQLLSDPQNKELLGVPITQPMVDLLCAILQ